MARAISVVGRWGSLRLPSSSFPPLASSSLSPCRKWAAGGKPVSPSSLLGLKMERWTAMLPPLILLVTMKSTTAAVPAATARGWDHPSPDISVLSVPFPPDNDDRCIGGISPLATTNGAPAMMMPTPGVT